MVYKSNKDPILDFIVLTLFFIHCFTTALARIISYFRTEVRPVIYNAVKTKNWTLTLRLLSDPANYPHAKYATTTRQIGGTGPGGVRDAHNDPPYFYQGYNSLHSACDCADAPLNVIQGLLQAFSDAAAVVDDKGCTPLHYAARYARDEVVMAVLEVYPGAASLMDCMGGSPLLHAVRADRSRGVVMALLGAAPRMVLQGDKKGVTPWRLFFEVWEFKMMTLTLFDNVPTAFVLGLPVTYRNGSKGCVRDIYELVCEFLRIVGSDEMDVVHESLKRDCPVAYFHLLLRVNQEQAWMEDEKGRLLVHSISEGFYDAKKFTKMMDYLIQINPLAVSIPTTENRLLLNTVIERGYHNYENIFLTSPDAIRTRDVTTHMTSFMTAATVEKQKGGPLTRFTRVFDLLMKDPTLVSYGIPM